MERRRQFGWVTGGVCLIAVGVGLFWPDERSAAPEHGWVPSMSREPDPESHRRAVLDRLLAAGNAKRVLRDALLDDLIAGRRTLTQAVARCQEIEQQFPEQAEHFRRHLEREFPGCSYEEGLAHNLLAHCRMRANERPQHAGPALIRLESELAAFVRPRR